MAERQKKTTKKRIAPASDAVSVTRALKGVDLDKLTGRADLVRGVARFQRQVSPFTGMFEHQEKMRELFAGMTAMDSRRRDVLGTAFIASDITKSFSLDRRAFIDLGIQSVSTFAGAQLSLVAKQAMLDKPFVLPAVVPEGDPKTFAALTRLSEEFHKALSSSSPTRLNLGVTAFAESLRRVTKLFAGGAWAFIERRREVDERALLFVERHGWPLPLALPLRVVHRLARMAERGRREVTRLMVTSFQPRTNAYRVSRDKLLESEHFASRRQPIRQGLQALNRGHYYASICTLLPLVEGVLVDVVLAEKPPAKGAAQAAVKQLREVGDEIEAVTVGSIETLLVSATSGSALFDNFNRRDYGGRGESRRLNRHAILHGSARRYGTHANALKLFLLLVTLSEALDLYETEKAAK